MTSSGPRSLLMMERGRAYSHGHGGRSHLQGAAQAHLLCESLTLWPYSGVPLSVRWCVNQTCALERTTAREVRSVKVKG